VLSPDSRPRQSTNIPGRCSHSARQSLLNHLIKRQYTQRHPRRPWCHHADIRRTSRCRCTILEARCSDSRRPRPTDHGDVTETASFYVSDELYRDDESVRWTPSTQLREWNSLQNCPFRGDYAVFKERPLPYRLKLCLIGDVLYLDRLYIDLAKRLTVGGLLLAHEWSTKQVEATRQARWTASRQYVDFNFNRCWEEQINRCMKPVDPPQTVAPRVKGSTYREEL